MPKNNKKDLILPRDASVLREVASPVSLTDIPSEKVSKVIKKMVEALHGEEDGVAIAAPQVGEGLRIFVVNGEVLTSAKEGLSPAISGKSGETEDMVFINPEIVKISKKKKPMEEGCLSARWLYGEVMRSEKVTVRAYDEHGKIFQKGSSGLLAQIFQHEIDHLNGILFMDKATNIRNLPPTKQDDQSL